VEHVFSCLPSVYSTWLCPSPTPPSLATMPAQVELKVRTSGLLLFTLNVPVDASRFIVVCMVCIVTVHCVLIIFQAGMVVVASL
jgi:hypothetical protein